MGIPKVAFTKPGGTLHGHPVAVDVTPLEPRRPGMRSSSHHFLVMPRHEGSPGEAGTWGRRGHSINVAVDACVDHWHKRIFPQVAQFPFANAFD